MLHSQPPLDCGMQDNIPKSFTFWIGKNNIYKNQSKSSDKNILQSPTLKQKDKTKHRDVELHSSEFCVMSLVWQNRPN